LKQFLFNQLFEGYVFFITGLKIKDNTSQTNICLKFSVSFCSIVFFFLEKQGRAKKNSPTQLENRLGFPGELMEFNHSLVGFLFSRFLLVGLFSFTLQKKVNNFFANLEPEGPIHR
jgi:hypothetical protein